MRKIILGPLVLPRRQCGQPMEIVEQMPDQGDVIIGRKKTIFRQHLRKTTDIEGQHGNAGGDSFDHRIRAGIV